MTKKLNKTLATKSLLLATTFAALFSLQTAAQAADKDALPTTESKAVAAHPAESDTAVKAPDTPEAIWQAVDKETDEMAKLIEAGTISELHHHAFAVRDFVAALPAASASLPADKMDKVKSNSKFVATLAERLDAAGDGNDKAAAASNFRKLQDVLKTLRSNYADSSPNSDNTVKP